MLTDLKDEVEKAKVIYYEEDRAYEEAIDTFVHNYKDESEFVRKIQPTHLEDVVHAKKASVPLSPAAQAIRSPLLCPTPNHAQSPTPLKPSAATTLSPSASMTGGPAVMSTPPKDYCIDPDPWSDDLIEITSQASPMTRFLVERENARTCAVSPDYAVSPESPKTPSVFRTAAADPPTHDGRTAAEEEQEEEQQPREPVRTIAQSYRLTAKFAMEACINSNIFIWVNRPGKRLYYRFHTLEAFMVFMNHNKLALDTGMVCIDETCVHELQKARIDFDCEKKDCVDISDDFTEGSHVAMITSVAEKFAEAISNVHGHIVSARNLLIFSSCRKEKISFHFVYPEGKFPRNIVEIIERMTSDACPENVRGKLDLQIYTKNHCFRLFSSCKFSKDKSKDVCTVDTSSMKKMVSISDLFGNKKVLTLEVDRCGADFQDRLLESMICTATSPALLYDDKYSVADPRPLRNAISSSLTTGNDHATFFSENRNNNLYSIIEKAASTVCGGEFTARDYFVTSTNIKYMHYNVDRKTSGMCSQCKTEHALC